MARSMNIQPPFSGGMPRPLPQPVQAHDHQQGQEDLYRSTARTVGVLLTRHSRALGHAADASASLSLGDSAFQATMGAASLALGVVDGVQAREAFKSGDRVMGTLNTLGCAANLVGGGLGLAHLAHPSGLLGEAGNVAQSVGVLADAAEDFVEARRLDRPDFLVRGSTKGVGAGLLLAGTLSGDPSLQMLGNLVCLGGLVLHYLPLGGLQGPNE